LSELSESSGSSGPAAALARLGEALPAPPKPLGAYVPVRTAGDLMFTSGMLPMRDGRVAYTGRAGAELSVGEAKEAAVLCARNAVAALAAALGGIEGLSRVREIVQVTGHVLSAEGFSDQPAVVDGASTWLLEVFGEAGRHTRLALGAFALPKNAAVELALVVRIGPA